MGLNANVLPLAASRPLHRGSGLKLPWDILAEKIPGITPMCWHPLAENLQRRNRIYDT